jgi:hypothetical protein
MAAGRGRGTGSSGGPGRKVARPVRLASRQGNRLRIRFPRSCLTVLPDKVTAGRWGELRVSALVRREKLPYILSNER